jgi:peptidase E
MRIEDISYISIDATHQIEVMPDGSYYPMRARTDATGGFCYYITGNIIKSHKTEQGVRDYLAKQSMTKIDQLRSQAALLRRKMCEMGDNDPGYRKLSNEWSALQDQISPTRARR